MVLKVSSNNFYSNALRLHLRGHQKVESAFVCTIFISKGIQRRKNEHRKLIICCVRCDSIERIEKHEFE